MHKKLPEARILPDTGYHSALAHQGTHRYPPPAGTRSWILCKPADPSPTGPAPLQRVGGQADKALARKVLLGG
jgi:hypothetical protein